MENIEPHNTDGELIALHDKVEHWLIEHGEYLDDEQEVAANNLTLWAGLFLKVSEQEAEESCDRLRKEGATDFVARVRCSAGDLIQTLPGTDPREATLNSYANEVLRFHDL